MNMKKNNTLGLNCHLTRKSLYVAMATISHLMLSATPVLAGPEGGKVVGGGGSIDQSGLNTTIRQQTDRMAIDWQSFNVAADEKVKFIQPDSSSIALNRVLSHTGSEIHGQIEANGHILLVNPNGVFFGEYSRINVGGMIASGLQVDPNDFMNGNFTLTAMEGTDGKVINSGIINAATGGSVTFVGQQVKNEGLISAKLGAVNLAAGKEAVITFDARGLVGVRVTQEVLQDELGIDAAVINSGEINAEGGRILLSASTSQDIFSQAVNHGSLNSATSVAVHEDGSFTLGAGADVVNTGNLSVSGNSGAAGQIVLIGENITTSGNIHADAVTTNAGRIELHSVDTTLITDSAKITAKATSTGKGGDVKILGNKVGLLDSAQINASGANGGGEILFGGDESGSNIRIRNADFIYLSENSKVNTDAILNGNGGKLITFASDTARIYGELSARGGALGGNGGFVETSGLKSFEILQTPDVRATQGMSGHWLIDPYDITIQTGGELDKEVDDEVDEGFKFESGVGATTLDVGVLESALNGGVTVTVRTGAGDEGFGNINFATDLEYNFSGSATLILDAHNNIDLGIFKILRKNNLNGESLNVEMHSRSGNITFGAGARVITHGGIFKASGVDFTLANANTDDFFAIDTSINPGDSNANPGGDVTLNMTGAISLGSSIRTDGGNFTVINSSSFTNNFDHAVINTFNDVGGGDISITSMGTVDLGAVNFAYKADNYDDQRAVKSGSISINTTGDVVLHKEIDFNNTEMFEKNDPNADTKDQSFLSITAGKNISILKSIIDSHDLHERDTFDITLNAGGDIDVQGSIFTSGGNLIIEKSSSFTTTATAPAIDGKTQISTRGQSKDDGTFSGYVEINSSGAVTFGTEINTNGGKVTINAGDTVTLNNIDTEYEDDNTKGALVISVANSATALAPAIQQSPSTSISAGNTVLNVGTGNVDLTGDDNNFTGDMTISSAGTVNITNTAGLNLGKSNINGAFTLTTAGDITQGAGELFVGGITRLTANGGHVELNHKENDFVGVVNLLSVSSLNLKDVNELTLGNVNTSGTANRAAGNVTIDTGGALTVGSIIANGGGGNEDNRKGGLITLTADGNIKVAGISTVGAAGVNKNNSRTGGTGGDVSLDSSRGGIEVGNIDTSGGDGLTYGDSSRNGGSAGSITITTQTAEQHIVLKGDLTAQGGKRGHNSHQNGAGKKISITGSVQLADTIEIHAGVKSGASGEESRGSIVFNGGVDSDSAATARNLRLTANSVTFREDVGNIYRLGDLNINAVGDVVARSEGSIYRNISANTLAASTAAKFHVGNITTAAATATDTVGGKITIAANSIRVGAIDSSGLGTQNGGAVAITGSRNDASIELTGNINSQAGTESEQGQGSVNLTLLDAGSISLNHTNFFTSTVNITGSNGVDILNGFNIDSTWSIDGVNSGNIGKGTSANVNFSGFENLVGGIGSDRFLLRGGYVSTINGGSDSGSDTLVGDNLRNTWTLLTNSSGTLASANPINYSLSFNDVENLTGNTNVDTFNFNFDGTYGGDVDAVGADNIVMLADGVNANIRVKLGQTLNGVKSANIIMGNDLGSITVEGESGDTHKWTISDLGEKITEADGDNDGEISNGTDIIRFINFINLNGSDASDNFTLTSGSSITGQINGGGGINTLVNETADSVWSLTDQKLTNSSSNVIASFSNIQTIAGSNSDTLIGLNQANDWQVQGTNSGYVQKQAALEGEGQIKFSGMNNLTGGTNADEFTFWDAGKISGNIDGGDGVDKLIGRNSRNFWSVGSSDRGTISSSIVGFSPYVKFFSIENLQGGKGADTFTFASSGDITGVIDGGTHGELEAVDTLDLASLDGEVHVELFKRSGTTYLQVLNVEKIIAPTATPQFNFLYGASDRPYTWTIDGANSGTLAAAANPSFESSVEFSNFGQLRGGTNSDRFVFTDESRTLAGHIDGGSQLDNGEDIVDLSNLNNADVSLSDTTYINIEKIIGNEKGLLTNTETSVWTLLGDNSGKVNNILFEGFASLAGGDGNDTFNLTQGSLSGSVHGGKGDDTFTVSSATIDGSVFGDAGNDHFIAIITPGNRGNVDFVGGDAGDRLEVRGGNTEYYAQHSFTNALSGEFLYKDVQDNKYNLSYTGITNITDNVTANLLEITTTSAADTITLKKDAYSLNAINVNYKNKENLNIAASAADEVVISGAVDIPELLTIQDARVSAADTSSVITAKGVLLDGTAQVGTSANRVKVNIDNLYARYANGAIYLQEQRGLNIGEFSSSSLLDIRLEGDLTSSVALSSSQDVSIATSNGNIVLDKENALSGGLNLAASNSINLRNLTTTNLKNVSARNLTINSTGVINGGGFIQVDGLASLVSGGNINLANQNHNFNFVQIGSAANVSINNVDSLRLTGVTASGALNINAQGINVDGPIDTASVMLNAGQGDAVLSSNVAVDGIANVVGRNITVDGDLLAANIQLDASQGQVLINGRLNTDGKESVTVTANHVVQNGLISSGTGITVQATDSITQNADITVATDVLLSAGGDLFMNARRTTQGQQVNYSAGGNMALADINATKAINISAAGNANQRGSFVSTSGDIIIESGGYIMDSGAAITANTGSVILKSSAGVSARKINAATDVSLTVSGNVGILDEVATTQGTISIQGRDVTLASNLVGNAGIDVRSVNGDIQQQAQLNSEQGDIRVVADGNITMDSKSSTLSTSGSIEYSGASLGITSFDALKTVTLDATRGAVTDLNGNDNNITAQRLVVDAATGIGSNDIIETLVDELSVSNNVGDIRIQNNKAVTVDRLRSNGNIVFDNLIGSVMLDNSQGTLFSRSETDARLAGGTMNANYDIGTLSINVAAGDLIASGIADLKNPDIVARNAALIAPIGNIGTLGRPLVIYVKDSLFIAGFNSWNPFWAFGASPATVDNASTIQGNLSDLLASGNEALVVVEALNEVDPAIFTSVRNYSYDDISILLPIDQLYYGD